MRIEKVVWKDIKLRTFITEDGARNDLAAHVYDVTYGSLVPYEDNLVVIDDSIVRGTTLRESIFKILDRLHPKKIVMVSSSPQIRYPDYYGIDMSHLEELCAFRVREPCAEDLRAVHDGADRQEDRGDAPAGRDADAGRTGFPERRGAAPRLSRPPRRLVFHRGVSHARRRPSL